MIHDNYWGRRLVVAVHFTRPLFFLQLNANTFLVPCYDFDLIWHAHQLFPKAYKNDTKRLLGKLNDLLAIVTRELNMREKLEAFDNLTVHGICRANPEP